ncbi:helix-turn-helix domain-containing protein [Actinocorallia sp. API 0066]|uniref:helix-turn-helix domain-containing protein n=1 Tax=Actinocorallia sp. API 0066 TaxID=2896846 RepID=UPI001E39400C|nr:helix-turn-helix domain-containing protein [Actinocorallia sp. API 0066]MCD0453472.1 helix-turn-helix domain-containing protein [Actinocorallia sp. API 0066]
MSELVLGVPGVRIREEVATRLLDRVDALGEQVVAGLRAAEPVYNDGVIPPQDPPEFVRRSLENGLIAMRGDAAEALAWPGAVGRHRAHQGVPVVSLQRAYHLGGQTIAGAVTRWCADERHPPEVAAALVDRVWDLTFEHASTALDALRATRGDTRDQRTAGYLLDALLNGETDESFAEAVERGYALPLGGGYAVICHRPAADGPPLRPAELTPWVGEARVIWRMHGECALGLVVLAGTPVGAVHRAFRPRPGRRTSVSIEVGGLMEIGRARQLADLACRTMADGRDVVSLEDRLAAGLLGLNPDLAARLCDRVLGSVLALEPASRDPLLETLRAWLAADGAAGKAATVLSCHRNTVLHRLRRLERLTGRSVTSPRDLVELSLALEAIEVTTGRRIPLP